MKTPINNQRLQNSRKRIIILAERAPDFLLRLELVRWLELKYGKNHRLYFQLAKWKLDLWWTLKRQSFRYLWKVKIRRKPETAFWANDFGMTEAEMLRMEREQ